MSPSEQNIGLLSFKQIRRLSKSRPYTSHMGFAGLVGNALEAKDLRRESFVLSEAFQVEVTVGSSAISALPLALMIPVFGRIFLGWRLGKARHAYLSNRLNRQATQQPLATLLGTDAGWVFSSQRNFLVFARSVNGLLADNNISTQIIGLCPKGTAREKRHERYRRFCDEVSYELNEHANFCAERDIKCQDAYQEFSERVDPLVLQHSMQKSQDGLLTGGAIRSSAETADTASEDSYAKG